MRDNRHISITVTLIIVSLFGDCSTEDALNSERHPEGVDYDINYWIKVTRGQEIINSTLTQGGHYRAITLTVSAFNSVFALDLHLNTYLFAVGYIERSFSKEGVVYHNVNHTESHCYYIGKVRDESQSTAAVSTCKGIVGYFTVGNISYHIDPASHQLNGRHKVYRGRGDAKTVYRCGHESVSLNSLLNPERHNRRTKRFVWPQDLDQKNKVVELYVANDHSQYLARGSSMTEVIQRAKNIVNIANAGYQSRGIYLVLVGIEVWDTVDKITVNKTDEGSTLDEWAKYRMTNINPIHYNDNGVLITNNSFGTVVGLAYLSKMCKNARSAAFVADVYPLAAVAGSIMDHEMGHNFGLAHDDDIPGCVCSDPNGKCIMSAYINPPTPSFTWSECSKDRFAYSFQHGLDICLYNVPQTIQPDNTLCGNGIVDNGEQCDCGNSTDQECNKVCCNPTTCELVSPATCAYGRCCNISTCQLLSCGTLCRAKTDTSCDLDEFCDGNNHLCSADTHLPDGANCTVNGIAAYCYDARCRSHQSQCELLWGQGTLSSSFSKCYNWNRDGQSYGSCGINWIPSLTYIQCSASDLLCGTLQCQDQSWNLSYYRQFFTWSNGTYDGDICHTVMFDFGLDTQDPGFVPNGASCGTGQMCVNQQCLNISTLNTIPCTSSCQTNEVCNNMGQCQSTIGRCQQSTTRQQSTTTTSTPSTASTTKTLTPTSSTTTAATTQTTPTPTTSTPTPTTNTPTPTTSTPTPTTSTPTTTKTTPISTTSTPTPTTSTPTTTKTTPIPPTSTPTPTTKTAPILTTSTPTPTTTTPKTTKTAPIPTTSTPTPTISTPTTKKTTPIPTISTPTPTTSIPTTTKTAPILTTSTPTPTTNTPTTTKTTPIFTTSTPTPTTSTPTTTKTTPIPTKSTPIPTTSTPTTTKTTPIPTTSIPTPTRSTPTTTKTAPILTTSTPTLTTSTPTTTKTAPIPTTSTPTPTTSTPTTTKTAPILTTSTPTPTTSTPTTTKTAPILTTSTPTPTTSTPTTTKTTPIPTTSTPTPTTSIPTTTKTTPIPTTNTPTPTTSTPTTTKTTLIHTTSTPTPTTSTPTTTKTTPIPTTSTPNPTTSTPKTTKTTPIPTTSTPTPTTSTQTTKTTRTPTTSTPTPKTTTMTTQTTPTPTTSTPTPKTTTLATTKTTPNHATSNSTPTSSSPLTGGSTSTPSATVTTPVMAASTSMSVRSTLIEGTNSANSATTSNSTTSTLASSKSTPSKSTLSQIVSASTQSISTLTQRVSTLTPGASSLTPGASTLIPGASTLTPGAAFVSTAVLGIVLGALGLVTAVVLPLVCCRIFCPAAFNSCFQLFPGAAPKFSRLPLGSGTDQVFTREALSPVPSRLQWIPAERYLPPRRDIYTMPVQPQTGNLQPEWNFLRQPRQTFGRRYYQYPRAFYTGSQYYSPMDNMQLPQIVIR